MALFQWFEGVRSCSDGDSLITVVEQIVKAEVHRLLVLNAEKKIVGIISLSDILSRLVLQPPPSDDAGGKHHWVPSRKSQAQLSLNLCKFKLKCININAYWFKTFGLMCA